MLICPFIPPCSSLAIPSDESPMNEGKPPMPEKPLWDARDAIIALSTSSRLRKLCTYETGGKSGTRVKSTIRHPKFGVRSSENLLRWKRSAQKPVRFSWPITNRSSSFFNIRSATNRFLAYGYCLGQRHFRRRLPIRRGPDYQPGRPGCDPPSLHRSDDGFCHAGQGG